MDCSQPSSPIHRVSQSRTLEWIAISFSMGSSWPRDQTCVSCICRWIFYHWATREAPYAYIHQFSSVAQLCLTLRPHELQHARPPCPSPTPRVPSNSRLSSQWCHPAIPYIHSYMCILNHFLMCLIFSTEIPLSLVFSLPTEASPQSTPDCIVLE